MGSDKETEHHLAATAEAGSTGRSQQGHEPDDHGGLEPWKGIAEPVWYPRYTRPCTVSYRSGVGIRIKVRWGVREGLVC